MDAFSKEETLLRVVNVLDTSGLCSGQAQDDIGTCSHMVRSTWLRVPCAGVHDGLLHAPAEPRGGLERQQRIAELRVQPAPKLLICAAKEGRRQQRRQLRCGRDPDVHLNRSTMFCESPHEASGKFQPSALPFFARFI